MTPAALHGDVFGEASETPLNIRILLADDHQILREGLKGLLEKQKDMIVVGEASDGRMAVTLAKDLIPNVIVMDIGMPDLNGVEATRQILEKCRGIKIIALSLQADGPVVRRMFQAGAVGYLLKEAASDDLVKAIRTVVMGRTYLGSQIAGVVVQQMNLPDPAATSPLTAKEREVLQLLAEGKTTKEIAASLFVSAKTIDTHRQHIMNKLDIHNVAELTKYAIREGITSVHH